MSDYIIYTGQRGDSIAKIAKQHNVKNQAIIKCNPDLKNKIRVGQKIKIPKVSSDKN